MERPEPRVRLCQIERGGGKLVAEGDVRAVAPLMKVLDWLDRRKQRGFRIGRNPRNSGGLVRRSVVCEPNSHRSHAFCA